MSVFTASNEDAHYLSRQDATNLLGTYSDHAIYLEGTTWPTIEHYFQAMRFEDKAEQEKLRLCPSPAAAVKLARPRLFRLFGKKQRRNWPQTQTVYMTRGIYTKCKAHPEVALALLATANSPLVENSQYDYFWGCGRDRRGENQYGRVLMQVRTRLREELSDSLDSSGQVGDPEFEG